MVSLRFRPEWFKARSLLGYGADWPLDWRRNVGLLRPGRAGPEDFRPSQLPLGTETAALPLPASRIERRGAGAGARLRDAGDRLGADSARDDLGPARFVAALRLSRLLRAGLRNQCQAERADHLDPACRRSGRGDPRSCDGRPDRDRTQDRPCLRRPLLPRSPVAVSAREKRRRRRLRDRDAPPAAQFRRSAPSGRARQQLGPRRPQPDGAGEPGSLRHDGRRRCAGTKGRPR